jgi:hypothetical protein
MRIAAPAPWGAGVALAKATLAVALFLAIAVRAFTLGCSAVSQLALPISLFNS